MIRDPCNYFRHNYYNFIFWTLPSLPHLILKVIYLNREKLLLFFLKNIEEKYWLNGCHKNFEKSCINTMFHDCEALNKLMTALKQSSPFYFSNLHKVIQRACRHSLLPFLQHLYNDQCSLHWNAKTDRQYPLHSICLTIILKNDQAVLESCYHLKEPLICLLIY